MIHCVDPLTAVKDPFVAGPARDGYNGSLLLVLLYLIRGAQQYFSNVRYFRQLWLFTTDFETL